MSSTVQVTQYPIFIRTNMIVSSYVQKVVKLIAFILPFVQITENLSVAGLQI